MTLRTKLDAASRAASAPMVNVDEKDWICSQCGEWNSDHPSHGCRGPAGGPRQAIRAPAGWPTHCMHGNPIGDEWEWCPQCKAANLAASAPAGVGEEWQLVPKEPTSTMIQDAQVPAPFMPDILRRAYISMLAAAPEPVHTDKSTPCPTCGFRLRRVERAPFVIDDGEPRAPVSPAPADAAEGLKQKVIIDELVNQHKGLRQAAGELRAERDQLRAELYKLLPMRDMLILCGEPEIDHSQPYELRLRALIDGVSGLRAELARMSVALHRIERWELPTPDFGDKYGSNGERDYMRRIASAARTSQAKEHPND